MSRKMYKIVLKKNDRQVGDLGEFETQDEAHKVMTSFNTKPVRRGATAHIVKMNKNPSTLGSLFDNDSESMHDDLLFDDEFLSEEFDEEPEETTNLIFHGHSYSTEHHDESISEDTTSEQESIQTYRNPLDLWPIHKPNKESSRVPQKNVASRRNVVTAPRRTQRKLKAPYPLSIQAVMIDDEGYVLIRKPSNKYRGISWEFYGGKAQGGEDIEEALRREVKEETGYDISLKDKIGDISIDGGFQKYFLISPSGYTEEAQIETENTYWVSQEEAWRLLGKNKEPYKRKLRDILDKAYSTWRNYNVRYR